MQGVIVRIVRDPELIGKALYGYTHPNGSIDLYGHPNRFAGDPLRMNQELRFNENTAHGIEDSFWEYYQKNKTGRLGEFE